MKDGLAGIRSSCKNHQIDSLFPPAFSDLEKNAVRSNYQNLCMDFRAERIRPSTNLWASWISSKQYVFGGMADRPHYFVSLRWSHNLGQLMHSFNPYVRLMDMIKSHSSGKPFVPFNHFILYGPYRIIWYWLSIIEHWYFAVPGKALYKLQKLYARLMRNWSKLEVRFRGQPPVGKRFQTYSYVDLIGKWLSFGGHKKCHTCIR